MTTTSTAHAVASTRVQTRHERALDWARQQIGKAEQPPGSNRGAFVDSLSTITDYRALGVPWCARFALAAIVLGGKFNYPHRSAGAWDLGNDAARRGWRTAPADHASVVPGDLVTFNIGSGHIGVVESIQQVGGQWICTSIDGNSGDMVKRCQRPLSVVRDFICWPEDAGDYKPGRRKLIQVLGGESGRRKLAIAQLPAIRIPASKEKVT